MTARSVLRIGLALLAAFSLALTFLLVAAMLTTDRRLVRVALLALTVFAVPHAINHVTHLAGFPAVDAVVQTVGTIAQLLLAAGLFALTWRVPATLAVKSDRGSGQE